MEDQANRPVGDTTVESYWLVRKREREALEKKKDEQALEFLKQACEFYDKNYPNSKHGVDYEDKKGKLPRISFELERNDAILLRKVLSYYKIEVIISVDNEKQIGHCFWRINKCIPDLDQISRILGLEKKKIEIDKQIHRLKTMKAEIPKEIVVKEDHFICHWCDKEFVGETARIEIKEHVLKCDKSPTAPEESPEAERIPEKLFTCQLCEIQLNRADIIKHVEICEGTKKEVPIVEPIEEVIEEPKVEPIDEPISYACPVEGCGKVCKSGGGLASHAKIHNKEG